jgi:hypothetical protein
MEKGFAVVGGADRCTRGRVRSPFPTAAVGPLTVRLGPPGTG